jgi:hypothetical protein
VLQSFDLILDSWLTAIAIVDCKLWCEIMLTKGMHNIFVWDDCPLDVSLLIDCVFVTMI